MLSDPAPSVGIGRRTECSSDRNVRRLEHCKRGMSTERKHHCEVLKHRAIRPRYLPSSLSKPGRLRRAHHTHRAGHREGEPEDEARLRSPANVPSRAPPPSERGMDDLPDRAGDRRSGGPKAGPESKNGVPHRT